MYPFLVRLARGEGKMTASKLPHPRTPRQMPRPFGVPILPDIVGPETLAGHARHALTLVIFAEARLCELTMPPDPDALDLLAGARGRLWHVINELEAVSRPALPDWWWRLRRLAERVGWTHAVARVPTDEEI